MLWAHSSGQSRLAFAATDSLIAASMHIHAMAPRKARNSTRRTSALQTMAGFFGNYLESRSVSILLYFSACYSLCFKVRCSPMAEPSRIRQVHRSTALAVPLSIGSHLSPRTANSSALFVRIIPPMDDRNLTRLDRLLAGLGTALRNSGPCPARATRPNPAGNIADTKLSPAEEAHAAGLMRVNHAGEIAAQGLYQGHAAVARDADIESQMRQAATEELDHLGWCEARLHELHAGPSKLKPVWYAGAFTIGAISGVFGDKWSLGFIAETERQVSAHLTSHLDKLPANDERSRAIVRQMRDEEEEHGANAEKAGAATLPGPAKALMRACARIMTRTAYRV